MGRTDGGGLGFKTFGSITWDEPHDDNDTRPVCSTQTGRGCP
jgi:hypothetical protein